MGCILQLAHTGIDWIHQLHLHCRVRLLCRMDVREYTRYLLERKAIQVTHKIETIAYIALLCCIEFLAMFDLSKSSVYRRRAAAKNSQVLHDFKDNRRLLVMGTGL